MLSTYMKTGTKILGLSTLINSGKPGFTSCYRIVPVGNVMAIEFFDAAQRQNQQGMHSIGILPYCRSSIAEIPMGNHQEVISGEFTGCVMSLYKQNNVITAAHVDTNLETSKRQQYNALKDRKSVELIDEYDSTGKIYGANRIILCIANKQVIESYIVDKGVHSSHKKIPVPGEPGKFQTGQFGETIYTVR